MFASAPLVSRASAEALVEAVSDASTDDTARPAVMERLVQALRASARGRT
jgi:hypothetical protein